MKSSASNPSPNQTQGSHLPCNGCSLGVCFGMAKADMARGFSGNNRFAWLGMLLTQAMSRLRSFSSIELNPGTWPSFFGGFPRFQQLAYGWPTIVRMRITRSDLQFLMKTSAAMSIQEVPTLSDCGERRTVRRSSHRGWFSRQD